MMFTIGIVATVLAIVLWTRRISKRLVALEQEISLLRHRIDVGTATAGSSEQPQTEELDDPTGEAPETSAEDELQEASAAQESDPEPLSAASVVSDDEATSAAPARPSLSLENTIGANWTVWAGGITLALGAIFLARYSIEQGLLSPAARLTLGFIFSMALVVVGEWTRRRGAFFSIPGYERANIPATLTAAGTIGAFASVYAAYAIFNFIAPTVAFLSLSAIAVGTMLAALLHGPSLAAMGLLGSYAAPFLVSSNEPKQWALALYILVVSAATFGVARLRLWRWLAIIAALGLIAFMPVIAFIWPRQPWAMDLYVLTALAMTSYVFVVSLYPADPRLPQKTDRVATLLIGMMLIGSLAFMRFDPGQLIDFIKIAAVVFGATALVFYHSAVRYLLTIIIFITAARHLAMDVPYSAAGKLFEGFGTDGPGQVVSIFAVRNVPSFIFLGTVIGITSLLLGTYGAARTASRVLFAIAGTLLPILMVIITWLKVNSFTQSLPVFVITLLLCGAFAVASEYLRKTAGDNKDEPDSLWPSSIFVIGSFAALATASAIVLEQGFLTIALALVTLAVAYTSVIRPMPGLTQTALVLMLIWGIRVGLNPAIVDGELGTTPIFNWLLYGWGFSCAAFVSACVLFARNNSGFWQNAIEGITIAAVTIAIALLLTHAWDPAELFTTADTLAEGALYVLTCSGVALGLLHTRSRSRFSGNVAIDTLGYLGMAGALVVLLAFYNPLITGDDVGDGLIFNAIALGYLAPAVVFALIWHKARFTRPAQYANAALITSGILGFSWINLTVRKIFVEADQTMHSQPLGNSELYTYSAVWLILAIGLLGAGIVLQNRQLRMVSAGLMVLTIAKVFLIDMSSLTGLLRALSFIGLGLVLVAVGLVYQRLLRPTSDIGDETEDPVT